MNEQRNAHIHRIRPRKVMRCERNFEKLQTIRNQLGNFVNKLRIEMLNSVVGKYLFLPQIA